MRLGLTASETNTKLRSVFLQWAYSRATAFWLHKEYQSGHLKVGDKDRTSQPVTSRCAAKIRWYDNLVKKNRRVGIVELSKTLGISYGSVFRILHKDLLLKKHASKLVPHVLTAVQKRAIIQLCVQFLYSFPTNHALNYVMTTDDAWFYIHDLRPKIQNMQWLRKGEDCQQVPRRLMGTQKVMLILFFDRNGLVHCEYFVNQTIKKSYSGPFCSM